MHWEKVKEENLSLPTGKSKDSLLSNLDNQKWQCRESKSITGDDFY